MSKLHELMKKTIKKKDQRVEEVSLQQIADKLKLSTKETENEIQKVLNSQFPYIEQREGSKYYRFHSDFNKIFEYPGTDIQNKFMKFLIEHYSSKGLTIDIKKDYQDKLTHEIFLYINESDIVALNDKKRIKKIQNDKEDKKNRLLEDDEFILIFPRDATLGDDMEFINENNDSVFIPEEYLAQPPLSKQQQQIAQINAPKLDLLASLMSKVENDFDSKLKESQKETLKEKNTKKDPNTGQPKTRKNRTDCENKSFLINAGLYQKYELFITQQKQ